VYPSIFIVRVLLSIFGMCLCSIHELIETSRYYIYTSTIIVRFLVLYGCIDVQYLDIALILNTETTLNQNILIFILCLDLLKTYCWSYHFDLLIFIHHYCIHVWFYPLFIFIVILPLRHYMQILELNSGLLTGGWCRVWNFK
jgi:hypothetical protein